MTGQIQSTAKWYLSRPLDLSWRHKAKCGGRSNLPWTSNVTPTQSQFEQMRNVCDSCPVWRECADHGLRQEGGFYAGIWVPWRSTDGNTRGRDAKFEAAQSLLQKLLVAASNRRRTNTPTQRLRRELSLSSQRAAVPARRPAVQSKPLVSSQSGSGSHNRVPAKIP